jgi:hypothetical protein
MITNMPAFRLWHHTGKRMIECGAAWPNRAGSGFNCQMDSLFGQRQFFLVPNVDRDGKPQGVAPFKILYSTGRVRSDGGQHTRHVGVAHVSGDRQGYDIYIADPIANLKPHLRPIVEPTTAAANDDEIPDSDEIPDGVGAVSEVA